MVAKTASVLSLVMSLVSGYASAQEPEATAASEVAAPQASSPAPAPEAPRDHGRFRFGIDGSAGLERVSAHGNSASGGMYGIDMRFGWQFNDMFAVYAQPHLSFGSLDANGGGARVSGFTGTFIGTVLGEVTLLDRFFAGAGIGYGVFNNPTGFAIDVRAGVYPFVGRSEQRPRRKGLMLGVDFRNVFLDGANGIHVTGGVGYEAF